MVFSFCSAAIMVVSEGMRERMDDWKEKKESHAPKDQEGSHD
jgi:hypothetical protein